MVEAPQARPVTPPAAGIELRYRIVDVFSDRPLVGNPLCVVLDPCPEPVMQALAREANLSETTFPVVTGADDHIDEYLDALECEFAALGEPQSVATIFIGGGTPTYLSAGQLEWLLTAIGKWLPPSLDETKPR